MKKRVLDHIPVIRLYNEYGEPVPAIPGSEHEERIGLIQDLRRTISEKEHLKQQQEEEARHTQKAQRIREEENRAEERRHAARTHHLAGQPGSGPCLSGTGLTGSIEKERSKTLPTKPEPK